MPGMFSRRRGSSAAPPASRSTMSAATAAASQAYVNKAQSGTSSLSSAAAAAALRSHTTTPEPIGSLQTKRMMRRGSVTSVTSNGTGATAGRPGLQRQNSSGSMTERTFRANSRSPSRHGAGSPAIIAPPIPPLPKTLRNGPRRSSSSEPPERVLSPAASNGRRSMSVDKVNTAQATTRSPLQQVPEGDGENGMQGRRASVNFSRPRVGSPSPSPSPVSPVAPRVHTSGGWFGGPTGSIAEAGGASIQEVVQSTAKAAPRKAPAPVQTSQEMEYTMVFDAASRTFVRRQRPKPAPVEPPSPIIDTAPKLKPGEYNPATRSIVPFPITAKPAPAVQAPAQDVKHDSPAARPSTLLHKQPSVVREDAEAERKAEAEAPKQTPRAVSSSQGPAPAKTYTTTTHQRSSSLDVPRGGSDRNRGGSLSPSRSTRFSVTPILDSTRHEPNRGISPAKSALKHSPSSSIRTASPVATFSPPAIPQSAASDVSDTTSLTSADGSANAKKRRSVRVSFDDEGAKEPVPPIPVAKSVTTRPAFSDDEQDEVMQPRPDLPSFGSIRRNKRDETATETSPAANRGLDSIFKKQDEPAPPEVTSKDSAPAEDHDAEDVPAINLHPPTPAIDEDKNYSDDDKEVNNRMTDSQELRGLASGLIFYGEESDDSRARKLTEQPAPAKPVVTRKDSDADEYTDAPETQDGGQAGFASLDAIVESPLASPVKDTAPSDALTALPDSPSRGESKPDWTAASAHWSNISKQQKAQHELGQLSSDDEVKTKRSFFKRNKKPKETAPAEVAPPAETRPPSPPPQVTPVKSTPSNASQPLKPALKKTASPVNNDTFSIPRTMRGNDAPAKNSRPASAQYTGSPVKAAAKPVRPASMQYDSYNSVSSQRSAAPVMASSLTANKLSKKFQDDSDSESSFKKKKRPASTIDASGRYNMKRSMRAGSIDSTQRVTSPTPSGRTRALSPSSIISDRPSLRMSLRGGPPDAGARSLRGQQKSRPSSSGMKSRFKSRFVDSDDEDDRSAAKPVYRSRFVDSDEEDNTIPEELTPVRGIPRRKGQEDGDSTDLDEETDFASPKKKASKGIVVDDAAVERAMEAARKKLGIAQPTSAKIEEGSALRQGTMRDRDNDKVLMSEVLSEGGSNASAAKKKRGFMGGLLRRNKGSSLSTAQLDTPNTMTTALPEESPSSPTAKLPRRLSNQPPKLQRGFSSLSTATAPPTHGRAQDEHWPLPPPIPDDRISTFLGRDTERPQTSDEALHSKRPTERPEARRSFSARVGFSDDAIAHSERDEGSVAGDVYSRRTGKKKRFGLLRRAFGLYD